MMIWTFVSASKVLHIEGSNFRSYLYPYSSWWSASKPQLIYQRYNNALSIHTALDPWTRVAVPSSGHWIEFERGNENGTTFATFISQRPRIFLEAEKLLQVTSLDQWVCVLYGSSIVKCVYNYNITRMQWDTW